MKTILTAALLLGLTAPAFADPSHYQSRSHSTTIGNTHYRSTTTSEARRFGGSQGTYRQTGTDGSSVRSRVDVSPSGYVSGRSTSYIPGVGTVTCSLRGSRMTCN